MPPRSKIPAPIDRPLSRAYLREFSGWSTAYPPGLSDPTSLRVMENVLVNRDGSLRTRPGLRHLSYNNELTRGLPADWQVVSTFESFYRNDGQKAWLFAYRDVGMNRIEFACLIPHMLDTHKFAYRTLTEAPIGFDISEWSGTPHFGGGTTYVKFLQIDNKILALSNNGEPLIVFHVGATKKVPKYDEVPDPLFEGSSFGSGTRLVPAMVTKAWIDGPQTDNPWNVSGATWTSVLYSLQSSDPARNVYNLGFFFTFSNELGESKPSNLMTYRVQRPLGGWSWYTPEVAGSPGEASTPSTTQTYEGSKASDQLVLWVGENGAAHSAFQDAVAAGATKWNIYAMSWSDQAPVPVEAQLVATKDLNSSMIAADDGWIMLTPATQQPLGPALPIPTVDNRTNSTKPPSSGQGLVASDRVILVNDPANAALIRWSTNEQGNYLNFAASRGAGYKTLTSGNMQIPACVKLWQNPESKDTLTILNAGTDGHSTAYYMAPASVSSQSDNTIVMGFEETTATPGTVSPYGCEVANNALYHPLDDQLMKSTASNYNINHKSVTDQIANRWVALRNKKKIVSCFYDQRLYYLVHNPDGAELEAGAMGNEIWVFDLAAEKGNWSRWLVQGVSLRKVELGGRVYLGLLRPDGVFFFDDSRHEDEVLVIEDAMQGENTIQIRSVVTQPITWRIETNTQGANRAHDAWCHLQQVNLTVGNFVGEMTYGVKAIDRHGQKVEMTKVLRYLDPPPGELWDLEDKFLVKRDLKEWYFFAEGTSGGQLDSVQYRYTPISVNDGYEYGSVETFEYGRENGYIAGQTTFGGVPLPMADRGTP